MANNSNDRHTIPPNMIRLCIDGYDEDIKGRIYSIMCDEPMEFDNCCEMLMKADEMFEKLGYPQAFCDSRNFITGTAKGHYELPDKPLIKDEDLQKQEGQLCTLDVLIRSRRQASWQGIMKPVQDSLTHEFSCGMELLRCIGKMISDSHNLQVSSIQ